MRPVHPQLRSLADHVLVDHQPQKVDFLFHLLLALLFVRRKVFLDGGWSTRQTDLELLLPLEGVFLHSHLPGNRHAVYRLPFEFDDVPTLKHLPHGRLNLLASLVSLGNDPVDLLL